MMRTTVALILILLANRSTSPPFTFKFAIWGNCKLPKPPLTLFESRAGLKPLLVSRDIGSWGICVVSVGRIRGFVLETVWHFGEPH
ncbi:hypothetical protein BJ165DRAFT_1466499 [Panaeolus papilionaceus]|nr:hypothetical protein BJ165DRAFT_1466499 [Panaeolus papilionaceus]